MKSTKSLPSVPSLVLGGRDIIEISAPEIEELKRTAAKAELKRARICLHPDHEDDIQEMIIAFCKGTYLRPHRHQNKSESFHVMEGKLAVVFFDDNGTVVRRLILEAGKPSASFIYRLNRPLWHTVIILSETALIHETTNGPFVREEREFAPWSIPETDPDAAARFISDLMK